MLDFNRLEQYRENNRIRGQEGAGRSAKEHLGDLLRLCQHAGRRHPAGRHRNGGQDLRFREPARSRQADPRVLAHH